jgi:hypothetical protein
MIKKEDLHKFIFAFIGISVLAMGIALLFIPPALFPDPANGFQVLRCMHLGGGFNNMVAPDQSDISQDYTEFLTWWSPGQYLIPWAFKLLTGLSLGKGIAITVFLCTMSGLAGLYAFFRKIGFSPLICALSLLFICCQMTFVVPYAYYNGGEILLFAFLGWFLYGCASLQKPGLKLILFVLLSGWIGFFLKSSFIWIYGSGLICLWLRLSDNKNSNWLKSGFWVGIPAVFSVAAIYIFFLSKGQSPANAAHGFKISAETFTFPLASPALSAFSIDDMLGGLIYNFGKPLLPAWMSVSVLILLTGISLLLIYALIRLVKQPAYRLFLVVFYVAAFLFFSFSYLKQMNISYEARHFRVLGLLVIPGMLSLVAPWKMSARLLFGVIWCGIAVFSIHYLFRGYIINSSISARAATGIAQPNIDQQSLNQVVKLDQQDKNAVFVFMTNDVGLEILHNRTFSLPAIASSAKVNMDDYTYDGFGGPLYIVLPKTYKGPREEVIMKSFPGYTGWNIVTLSDKYVLYTANTKSATK